MSLRFRCALIAWILVVAITACCGNLRGEDYNVGGWRMQIIPALKVPFEERLEAKAAAAELTEPQVNRQQLTVGRLAPMMTTSMRPVPDETPAGIPTFPDLPEDTASDETGDVPPAPPESSGAADGELPVIVPRTRRPVHGVGADGQPIDVSTYSRIYRSIPFSRAEYNANPSYRHDSTMELLTGNARHQTIRHYGLPRFINNGGTRTVVPYRFNNSRIGINYFSWQYFPYLDAFGYYR